MKKILVTGSAGFIGFHLSNRLLHAGYKVLGLDSLTNYYDVNLKINRNKILLNQKGYEFLKIDIKNYHSLSNCIYRYQPDLIIHLAAQAGVRHSLVDPSSYLHSNVEGTFNLLESLKAMNCEHLLIASTSSVYGANEENPYKEVDKSDTQLSFYAATKKSIENMSHSYSHLYGIPTTCFRFFTVYGPWGRPDMALFSFTDNILKSKPIKVFNKGEMFRDFTYVADLVEGVVKLLPVIPTRKKPVGKLSSIDSLSNCAPWRVVNIGSSHPRKLLDFIEILEECLGVKAAKEFTGMQPGDVISTFADISLLKALTDFKPQVSLETGISNFVNWYKEYYKQIN